MNIIRKYITLISLFMIAGLANAEQIWIYDLTEIEHESGLAASIEMRYLVNKKIIYYKIELLNKSEKIISVPPLQRKFPTMGIDPFYDIYIKINNEWIQWVENDRIKDEWVNYNTSLSYHPIFTRSLDIKKIATNKNITYIDHPDGIRISSIPEIPKELKLVLPYKKDNEEKEAVFILQQKTLADYSALLTNQ